MLTASLANAEQYASVAAGMLSQSSGRGHVSWRYAGKLRFPKDGLDLLVEVSDLFVELQKDGMERGDDIACQLGHIDLWIVDDLPYRALCDQGRLSNCHALLEKQTSHLRDQGDTMIDQSLPSAVAA